MAEIGKLGDWTVYRNVDSGAESWTVTQVVAGNAGANYTWYDPIITKNRNAFISSDAADYNIEIDWRNIRDKEGFLGWLRDNLFKEESQNRPEPGPKIDADQLFNAIFEE